MHAPHQSHLFHRACVWPKSPVDDCFGDFRGGGGGQGRRVSALFSDRAEHAAVRHGMFGAANNIVQLYLLQMRFLMRGDVFLFSSDFICAFSSSRMNIRLSVRLSVSIYPGLNYCSHSLRTLIRHSHCTLPVALDGHPRGAQFAASARARHRVRRRSRGLGYDKQTTTMTMRVKTSHRKYQFFFVAKQPLVFSKTQKRNMDIQSGRVSAICGAH